jgi:hypothetical protein
MPFELELNGNTHHISYFHSFEPNMVMAYSKSQFDIVN